MKKIVLLATAVDRILELYLHEENYELHYIDELPAMEMHWANAEGLVISNKLKVTADLIDRCPKLKWIARLGSGMEIVDVEYAKAKGISCISSPDGNSNAVAEHALGLLLSLSNNIVSAYEEIRAGKWLREENRGFEIIGKTVGLIGYGHMGSAFADKLRCLGVKLVAYDINPHVAYPSYVRGSISPEVVWEEADIISFHVPLNEQSAGMFDDSWVKKMRKNFFLINTSRGAVLKNESLLMGLEEGKITGAALDVWNPEPPVFNDILWQKLMAMKNVIATPHIAGYSIEAKKKMSTSIVKRLKTLLDKDLSA